MHAEWFVANALAHQPQAEIAAANLKSITTTVRSAIVELASLGLDGIRG